MTTTSQTRRGAISESASVSQVRNFALKIGRFLLHLIEMLIPMALGMMLFSWLTDQLPVWSSYRVVLRSETALYIIGDGLFMTAPMVAWMLIRGHDRRLSLEMGVAMFAPGIAIILLRLLGSDALVPWLPSFACPLMCSGMVVWMIFRHDHFTGAGNHSAHGAALGDKQSCH